MTKLADSRPPYCAACYQTPGDRRCVDFEAAYDGPVIPGSPANVPVDDLVICEDCLATAFGILDPQGLKETIAELTEMVRTLNESNESKDQTIRGLRVSVNELIDHPPVAKFPGKPKLEGVPPEVREQITKGRFWRRGTSSAPKGNKAEEDA